ncbi:uncharacterized protein LOC128177903 [Crassostrea angulata]|uniref:uncharacterized protein LOC128177903 n=1 Tax=Magallana angulata TaxID=2784310 RepID=UPI0022B0E491|nr:uncharacterized protein LOC128177903 [Crassostrea angulata]
MHWFTIILVGSVYQTPSVSTFSVSINASTKSIKPGENVHIDCTIFGLSPLQYLNSQVTLLLRQNDSIKTAVRIWTDRSQNVTEKYGGTVNYYVDDACQLRNRILVRFDIFNASTSDEGIYSFYTTHNSVTQYDSINLYSGNKTEKLSNYVVVRQIDTLESSIPYFCCKYGFSILENESFVNFINLRRNKSAYFPVIPTFGTNNNAIAIVKPWISYEGCYNLTIDKSSEMDCTKISVIDWTTNKNSLPLIGIKRKKYCVLLDKSIKETSKRVSYSYCLEDENTESVNYIELFSMIEKRPTLLEEINTSCMAAYTVKEANASRLYGIPCYNSSRHCDAYCLEKDRSNATYHGNLSWSEAMDICISLNKSLPGINSDFLSTSIDQENRSVCLAAYQSSSIVFQPVIKQINKDGNITALPSNTSLSLPFICGANPDTEKPDYCVGTTRAVKTDATVFTTSKCSKVSTDNDSKLIMIIPMTVLGFLLMVVAVVWVIHSETQEVATTIIRRGLDNNFINQTEAYSDLRNETHFSNEYTLTDENDEYDVLRSKRENHDISPDANIYDRANNLVSGIYDSTLRRIENKGSETFLKNT